MYEILFTKQADKTLRKMSRNTARLIRHKLESIAISPYAKHGNVTKLQNRPGYRLRVGDWRVIYEIQGDKLVILVLKIGSRRGDIPIMEVQFIERQGVAEWAVIPVKTYKRLLEDSEMLQDILDYDQAKRLIENGPELIPSQVTFAILDGQNPIKVWRTHRGLTQQEVASLSKISSSYLSQLESGKRRGTTDVLKSIADVLAVEIDDLVGE